MIRHAWHFYHTLALVFKVVCGSFGIACLTLIGLYILTKLRSNLGFTNFFYRLHGCCGWFCYFLCGNIQI
ncbi:DUF3265 domain-containing protein [Vibrio parahaemolyticus]|nr:DUF3265 domain-containing protein [Vibrio parahaemolyticus]EJL6383431.1 DUF3265 domain-containing protein [Vibrio parahaemolyticus]HCE3386930.1 DUF3265 domain-containing protein [Vibrio parahaemolyticus]